MQFWLHAPHDQLEALWNSGFGAVTRQLVQELTPQHVFTPQQVEQRNAIGEMLHQGGLDQPLSMQLMLANFLLSPPGLLTINNRSILSALTALPITSSMGVGLVLKRDLRNRPLKRLHLVVHLLYQISVLSPLP